MCLPVALIFRKVPSHTWPFGHTLVSLALVAFTTVGSTMEQSIPVNCGGHVHVCVSYQYWNGGSKLHITLNARGSTHGRG